MYFQFPEKDGRYIYNHCNIKLFSDSSFPKNKWYQRRAFVKQLESNLFSLLYPKHDFLTVRI